MRHSLRQATLELHCGAATSTWRSLSVVSLVDRDSKFAMKVPLKALFTGTIVQMMGKHMSHSRRDLSWEGLDFLPFAHGSVASVILAHQLVIIAHGLKCQSHKLTVAGLHAGRLSMFARRSANPYNLTPFICLSTSSRCFRIHLLAHWCTCKDIVLC